MEHLSTHIILFAATFFSGIVFIRFSPKSQTWIKYLLSFSGAFLFGLTILHFVPEVFQGGDLSLGLFVLIGFTLQIVLEFLSQGLDHGHGHGNKSVQWPALAGLFIHALIESTPLAAHQHLHHDHHDGVSNFMLVGLVLHKIPVAIVLGTLLAQNSNYGKTWKSYVLIIAFSLMAPVGLFFADVIPFIQDYHNELMGIVIGIFLYISTTILFEVSAEHKFNQRKFVSIIIGFGLAYLASA
jgi:hypothetical protein